MPRMKWTLVESGRYVSDCGRFTVGGAIWSKNGAVYVRLHDARTGREHCCRTLESAKAAARVLSQVKTGGA